MKGYWLNQAFNDLNKPECREALQADAEAYWARYPLSDRERQLVRDGDWQGCLEAGASVYTLTKLGAAAGISLLAMGAQMRGQTMAELTDFLTAQNEAGAAYQLLPDGPSAAEGGRSDG